jgi:N-acetylated-alpha-linked acidic dipeptidase
MTRYPVTLLATLLLLLSGPEALRAQDAPTGFAPDRAPAQASCEAQLLDRPTPETFRSHLQTLTQEPHPAGTPANDRVGDYIASTMDEAGLTVERYPYDLYMPAPASAHETRVELVTPLRMPLNRQEYILEDDRFTDDPALGPGWNAYSGSGDVTGEVVYANYGRKEDFEQLDAMGIDLSGKVVIARYGGNFRGYKAKYAEEYGAAGLIMYSDPEDGGYEDGLPYPDGRYISESTIQRGSVLTPLGGDPLTPESPSLPTDSDADVERLAPDEADLPRIPVTPLPHASAQEILGRMQGEAVPDGWQGGLPFAYRVTGGPDLTVRLHVDQPKQLTRATNIVGRIDGTTFPDEWIILGSHFDAWTFGATDPNSGTAMLLTLAEALGELAANGCQPRRSILIAHWDAEEYGILGSTEWVEQLQDELAANAVTYINADGAASGTRFSAASAPSMKQPILDATQAVLQPPTDTTAVYDAWQARAPDADEPPLGNLGGGSDHVSFLTYVGIPSAQLSMSSSSPIYHSNYDTFAWYEQFGDSTFTGGPALSKIDGVLTLRLANADVLPYDLPRYATDLTTHVESLEERAGELGVEADFSTLHTAIDALDDATAAFVEARDDRLANGALSNDALDAINQDLIALEKAFIYPEGLQNRPLKRSLYVSPDPFSGYASWMLPGLRYEIEMEAPDNVALWTARYVEAVEDLTQRVTAVTEQLTQP